MSEPCLRCHHPQHEGWCGEIVRMVGGGKKWDEPCRCKARTVEVSRLDMLQFVMHPPTPMECPLCNNEWRVVGVKGEDDKAICPKCGYAVAVKDHEILE